MRIAESQAYFVHYSCDSSPTAVTTAPQLTDGADVDIGRAEPGRAAGETTAFGV